jgi:tRNA pseudouridine38-40 synthase
VRRPSRRLRFDLAYDGTAFLGWQIQAEGRTVQGTVEEVLRRIDGDRLVRLRAAGRTDAGVHARLQVADGLMETGLDDGRIEVSLQRMLPADVRPTRVRSVPPEFDSQRDAVEKTYRYYLDLTRYGDPRLDRFAWRPTFRPDGDRLDEALGRLAGRRDWTGFAGGQCRVRSRVRNVTEARFVRQSDTVGYERLGAVLDERRSDLCGPTAPAKGLVLWHVRYGGEEPPAAETGPGLV